MAGEQETAGASENIFERLLGNPLTLVGVWLAFLILVFIQLLVPNIFEISESRLGFAGQLGDSFGVLSSLMATLAAVGAWRAVMLQREDKKEARIRAFNDTFFSMLDHLNAIVASTDVPGKVNGERVVRESRDAFKSMLTRLRLGIPSRKSPNGKDSSINLNLIKDAYLTFYDRYENDLGHYFRTIYQICRFIHDSREIDKRFYFRLVRSQLANSEQILIMYNCAVGYGWSKFRPLVNTYGLLHNLRFSTDGSVWEKELVAPTFERGAFDNDGGDDELPIFPRQS